MKTDNMIVILDDGETYASLKGCKVWILTDEGRKELDKEGDIYSMGPEHIANSIMIEDLLKESETK